MFVFTHPHFFESNAGVRQILVFPSTAEKDRFDKVYNERRAAMAFDRGQATPDQVAEPNLASALTDYPSENGIGAIYKVRAFVQRDGHWHGIIRDAASTGEMLWESKTPYNTPEECLADTLDQLQRMIHNAFESSMIFCKPIHISREELKGIKTCEKESS